MAFAQAFRETTAASLGVTADDIVLNGISTDGDDTPGCANGGGATAGTTIQVTDEFANSLHPTAFDDCWLSPEEMTTSPAAAAFAAAFVRATATSLGVDPSTITLSGISTDGDDTPGCANGGVNSGTTVQVTSEFADSLHPTAFDDCYLTTEEMATSPAAMAFAQAFRETTAASLGVTADDIVLNGISTDGDDT